MLKSGSIRGSNTLFASIENVVSTSSNTAGKKSESFVSINLI